METAIKYTFKSKEELNKYLKGYFKEVAKEGDYNLFAHKVFDLDFHDRRSSYDTVRTNMNGILKNGLNLLKYSSVLQTTNYLGELEENKATIIINYDYPWLTKEQIIVMVAIPSKVNINDCDINLSTPQFKLNKQTLYRKENESQYTMLFDALDYTQINKAFIVGAVVTDLPAETEEEFLNRGKEYELHLNPKFFALQTNKQKSEIMKEIAKRAIRDFAIKNSDTKEEIDDKIYKGIKEKDKVRYRSGSCEDDFDFD